jgi:hypothetical protein
MCKYGHSVVHDIFRRFNSSNLKGYLVWLPMILSDNSKSADTEASDIPADSRMTLWWNGDKSVGNAFATTLELKSTAWDVYLIYRPGTSWDQEQPPKPDFWMHQLSRRSGADPALCLNQIVLEEHVSKIIDGGEPAPSKNTKSIEFNWLRSHVAAQGDSDNTSCKLLSAIGIANQTQVRRIRIDTADGIKHVFNVLVDPVAKASSILVRYLPNSTECLLVSDKGELQKAVRTQGEMRTSLKQDIGAEILADEIRFWQTQLR